MKENIIELDTGKILKLTGMSAREVILRHDSLSIIKVKKNDNKEITAIKIDDFTITIGQIINIKLIDKNIRPFKINHIKEKSDTSYTLFATTLTKASRWIMPMIRVKDETQTSMKYSSYFVNCYVGTIDQGYTNEIYLVYRFSGDIEYRDFEEKLKIHPQFSRMIELDHHHTMYVFNMTMDNEINFKKFINGEYSKFTDDYKKKILSFVINPAITSEDDMKKTITYGVLYKTNTQKKRIESFIGTSLSEKAEFYGIPIESEEIYNLDLEIPKDKFIVEDNEI